MISIIIIIIIIIHTIIAITITTTLIVLLKSLVMITLAVFSLLVIGSVTATPHIITSVPSNTSILILSLPFFVMPFLYGANLYYSVIQPRRFFWSHASNKNTYHHHVCAKVILFANGGGLPPPQPPRFLKAMDACKKNKGQVVASIDACKKQASGLAVWIIHVLHFRKLRGSFCLQMGGAAPPPTPPLFKGRRCLKLPHFQYFHCFS